jgi:CRISPR-associated endoribonuclease Cas6
MPHSLVINLLPLTAIPTTHLSGRHLHGLFLELVRSVDPGLATVLHQQNTEKAFTLSPLQVTKNQRGRSTGITEILQFQHNYLINEGIPCWWRISLLDETLFSQLTQLWLNINLSRSWQLGATELQITSILGSQQPQQPWASFCTYAQLFAQASEQERQIQFLYCTPTTFRQTEYDCAMPTREFVFRSLLKRWNYYSGIPFPEKVMESIYPSFFDIHTEIVNDRRSKLIGCVGTVIYQILGDVEPEAIKQINALSDFALYAGVGRKTPMGMGMVRRQYQTHPNPPLIKPKG